MNTIINTELATLGGGCFWCLEAVYTELRGIERVVSGYMGGHVVDPTYEAVCKGVTGHAEVVQITYDPLSISFREILEVFFLIHDPTTLNRQGADMGPQYRSAIFHHTERQREVSERIIQEMAETKAFVNPIVTEVVAAQIFYPAENYHQDYYQRNMRQPYCQYVIAPKLAKFRSTFAERRRPVR
jgi:peptide-methionine (S)-S-oxide reductase